MSLKLLLTRMAQPLSSATKRGTDFPGRECIAYQPGVVLQTAANHIAARIAQACENEKSLAGLAPFRESFLNWAGPTLGNFFIQLG